MIISFLKRKTRSNKQIQKLNLNDDSPFSVKNLNAKIGQTDQEISQTLSSLIEAQRVSFASFFSSNQGLIPNLQRRFYQSAANNSFQWHKNRLIALYKDRRKLQILLEKATGKFWINRIKRWLFYFILLFISAILIWTIFMGVMAVFYILPFLIAIYILFYFIKRTKLF